MSQTDPHEASGASVDAPIVLIIGLSDSQKYLEDNEVLQAVYDDMAPRRIEAVLYNVGSDAPVQQRKWVMLYPWLDNSHRKLDLLELFPYINVLSLPGYLISEEFYRKVHDYIAEASGLEPNEFEKVRAIVGSNELFSEKAPMREVMKRFFPNATALAASTRSGSKPKKLELD